MKIKFLPTIVILSVFTGCVSLEQYPTNSYTDANYWTKAENVRAALYKAYSQCWNNTYYFQNNILSDDAYGSRHVQTVTNISTGISNTSEERYINEWDNCYNALRTVHTVLDKQDLIDIGDDAAKARMLAELRYIRAFTYLRLVTWWGDVPFYKKNPTLTESQTVTPAPADEIMSFIHSELDEISGILPKNTDLPAAETGRYTCGTAVALNARAYLLENDFENCAKECEKLINGTEYGSYSLASDYNALFNKHRGYENEAIMTVEYAMNGGIENIVRGWPTVNVLPVSVGGPNVWFSPTQELVDCFLKTGGTVADDTDYADRDKRFYATIAYNGCQMELPAHGKAKVKGDQGVGKGIYTCYTNPEDEAEAQKNDPNLSDSYNGSESRTFTIEEKGDSYKALIEIRFGDVLLMYAESMFETGKMTPDIWNKTIYPLRKRAGFDEDVCAYPGLTGEPMRQLIRNERRCELALEGRRVFDLRRWAAMDDPAVKTEGKAVLTSQATGAPFDNGGTIICQSPYGLKYWFPIPQSERDINDNLGQNPGW